MTDETTGLLLYLRQSPALSNLAPLRRLIAC